jgi:hypothetical protein
MTFTELTANDIVQRVHITAVWRALGGPQLTKVGASKFRGRAFWRDGHGPNVALDANKNCWFDHADSQGGGVLDLITQVRGGDRAESLHWIAETFGIPLDNKPLSREDRAQYARQKRLYERDLPVAQLWRRAAILMTEQVLDQLKLPLSDPSAGLADIGEIRHFEAVLSLYRRLEGTALVEQYRAFLDLNPRLTSGMVRAANRRARIEERTAWRLLGSCE